MVRFVINTMLFLQLSYKVVRCSLQCSLFFISYILYILATHFGRGVYFARDASYSCQKTFTPEDSQGLRYVYYAKVLVGDFTVGTPSMIVAPNKNTADPNETYDSVVDKVANPGIYVMFQDYEYYTEYLITFK